MLRIPYTSNDYVLLPLTEWSSEVADPTTLPVSIAIVAPGTDPAPGDYVSGSWTTEGGVHKARVLWQSAVPAAAAHTVYAAWLKITSSPETPVLYAGPIGTY